MSALPASSIDQVLARDLAELAAASLEDTPLVEIDGDKAYNFIFRRHNRAWPA